MVSKVNADLVGLLRGLTESLQPFADAHEVELLFQSHFASFIMHYNPEEILPQLTHLICRVITFTPQKFQVKISLEPHSAERNYIVLAVSNSGVNLIRMKEIYSNITFVMDIQGDHSSTNFRLNIPYSPDHTKQDISEMASSSDMISPYYINIRERLTTHFKNVKNLEINASQKSKKEGIYLKKANTIIYANLDQSEFKAESLAHAMALSRVQLHRKIKKLTGLSTGKYIQFVRLQKAKELLETTEMNVSEAAYQTGFASTSHFSRAFQKQFGFRPSDLKQSSNS